MNGVTVCSNFVAISTDPGTDVSRLQQTVESLRAAALKRRRHIRAKLASARELLHRRQLAHVAENERLRAEAARLEVRLQEGAKATAEMQNRLRSLLESQSALEIR